MSQNEKSEERLHEANHYPHPRTCVRSSLPPDSGVRRVLAGYARKTWRQIPLLMFAVVVVMASFAYGAVVGRYQVFPFGIISDGVKTLRTLRDTIAVADVGEFEQFADGGELRQSLDDGTYRGFSDLLTQRIAESRIQFLNGGSLSEPLLWYGGRFQFMELCPDWGCLAVEFGTDGEAAHAYPLRPDALEQAANAAATDEFPYELAPAFSFTRDVHPRGMSRYPNGDLLVTFFAPKGTSFPYSAGIARIDREGYPVWFRRDYSHHQPYMEDDGSALVPGLSIGSKSISFQTRTDRTITLYCNTSKPYLDEVNVINGDGRLIKSIDLMDALLKSPFGRISVDASSETGSHPRSPCDPLHLNYIHRIVDEVRGVWGMSSGDLVVSMRNLSAFAVLDGESGRIKRFVRGSFRYQHSVQHLEGSRFLMFDNYGSDGVYGPSRLLMVNLADGRETTVFPNDSTPESLRGLYSAVKGKISISPDRSRVIVTYSTEGVAVEVRLSDGAALNVFRSLHDVSRLEQFPDERATRSAVFQMFGLDYIRTTQE